MYYYASKIWVLASAEVSNGDDIIMSDAILW